jgi:hypothetical protein
MQGRRRWKLLDSVMSYASLCSGLDAGRLESSASASVTAVSALSCHPAAWRALPGFALLKGSAAACVTFTRPLALPRRLTISSTTVRAPVTRGPHYSPKTPSPQQATQPRFHRASPLHKPCCSVFLSQHLAHLHLSTRRRLQVHCLTPLSTATGAISVISTSSTATPASSPQLHAPQHACPSPQS